MGKWNQGIVQLTTGKIVKIEKRVLYRGYWVPLNLISWPVCNKYKGQEKDYAVVMDWLTQVKP